MRTGASGVFLNVPFDPSYEPYFLALIASVVAVGRTPRTVLEVPELGSGRVKRLLQHIAACDVSIHDLSRVGLPVRFNMPFELGLACAAANAAKGRVEHGYIVLERVLYRLDRTLSDIKGIDPYVYGNSRRRLVACVLEALKRDDGVDVDPKDVMTIANALAVESPKIRRRHAAKTVFTSAVFRKLVVAASVLAEEVGLLELS